MASKTDMVNYFQILFVIILFVWISLFPQQPLQEKFHIAKTIFLALAFIFTLIKKPRSIFKQSDFPLWLFLMSIFINVLFAQERNIALKTYLDLAIPMFLIYYLISESVTNTSRLILLATVICIASGLVALLGIFESLFAFNPIYKHFTVNPYYERYITGFVRPMSTQVNPAALGTYLLASLPFNFLLFKQNRFCLKLLGSVGLVLTITVIILVFSRGVFLGLITMVVFYFYLTKRIHRLGIFFIILSGFILVCNFLPFPINKLGTKSFITAGIVSTYRFDRYIMTQRILKGHPMVGLGFQNFRTRFYEYYPRKGEVPYEFRIPDNMYLVILSETGAIGFLGFFIFIFSLFKKAHSKLKILNDVTEEKQPLLLILSAFVGLLVSMVGYELFYWPNQYACFCILVGLIEAYHRNITSIKDSIC